MKVYYSSDSIIFKDKIAATVGFFDGVHSGHRFLINQLKSIATSKNCLSVVFTFSEHPRKILHADYQPALLTTLDEKLTQLHSTGVDACVVLEFSEIMAQLSAFDFLKTILLEQNNVTALLVGHDHRFGHNRAEGFDDYFRYGLQLGIEVIQAQRYTTSDFHHISSSEIRLALLDGDIPKANKILSYKYSMHGKVINGFKVGRKIGFPTANIKPFDSDKLIPCEGVYAVQVVWQDQLFSGMMNIGQRPTLNNGTELSLEVHIIDFNENIYYETIEIRWVEKIRNEIKFNSMNELIEQLKKDKIRVFEIFNN